MLLAKHAKLIRFATKRYVRARRDLAEDVLAVAQAEFLDAAKAYRADVGVMFTTFAVNRVRWAVSRFMREFTRHDRLTKSMNEPVACNDDGDLTLADVVDQREAEKKRSERVAEEGRQARICDLRRAIAECRTLTRGERKILEAFLGSGDTSTAAVQLGLTNQRITQALSSVKAKLKKHLRSADRGYI